MEMRDSKSGFDAARDGHAHKRVTVNGQVQ
jgi:hypothetical protein